MKIERSSLCATGARKSGFTLIEVLLAVTIFAIVLSAIHMVFYGAIRLRDKTTDAIEQSLPLEQALAVMKRDLANIVLPGGTFFGELQTTPTLGNTSNLVSTLSPVNPSVPGLSGPAFFTSCGVIAEGRPWGEIERVSYSLAPPTNNTPGKDLIRSVTRNLLPTFQDQPENQWLMSGLQSITFSFYDGLQWRDYWDSTTESNKLPQGIKVQMQLAAELTDRSMRPPIELVVPVMVQPETNQTAQASGDVQ